MDQDKFRTNDMSYQKYLKFPIKDFDEERTVVSVATSTAAPRDFVRLSLTQIGKTMPKTHNTYTNRRAARPRKLSLGLATSSFSASAQLLKQRSVRGRDHHRQKRFQTGLLWNHTYSSSISQRDEDENPAIMT